MQSNFFGILTPTTPEYTVGDGFDTTLYDTTGNHWIEVAEGGQLSLLGVQGNNTIRLHGNSSLWQVQRDGSTAVFIKTTNGKRVEVPATLEEQTVKFNNGEVALRVDNSGSSPQVRLGEQVLGTTSGSITALGGSGNVPSTQKTPWTIGMHQDGPGSLFFSDGTTDGSWTYTVGSWRDWDGLLPNASQTRFFGVGIGPDNEHASISDGTPAGTRWIDGTESLSDDYAGQVYGEVLIGNDFVTNGQFVESIPDSNWYFSKPNSDNSVLWLASYGPYGLELSRLNIGSDHATDTLVNDIWSGFNWGINDRYLYGALLGDGRLVFQADDGVHGSATWVSDGTEAGTYQIFDPEYDYPWLESFGDKVVFRDEAGIYITDGTAVTRIDGDTGNQEILGIKNEVLYYTATGENGRGIYRYDGVSAERLAGVNANSELLLAWDDGKAFYAGTDGTHGRELWAVSFDGDELSLVKDILPGADSALAAPYSYDPIIVNGKLAFSAYIAANYWKFFLSDGTENGTIQIGNSQPLDHAVIGAALVFADGDGVYAVDTDTVSVQTLVGSGIRSAHDLQSDTDQAFFRANDGKLYTTSGSGKTELLGDVAQFRVVADDAVFAIRSDVNQLATLWYSDGTLAGTRFITDLAGTADDYDLANAAAIHTPGAPDTTAPQLTSARINGATLTLAYADLSALDAAHPPLASAFSLSGTSATVSAVAVDATTKTVTLTLSQAVSSSDSVKLSYTDPGSGNDTAAIQDALGNDAASFSQRSVTNQTPDDVGPSLVSATANGNTLVLAFSDKSLLDAAHLPLTSAFSLSGTSATVSAVAVEPVAKTLTLTLSAALQVGDVVTVSYTDPGSGNDTAAIQDALGNDAASFSNHAVQNNTQEQAPWTLLMTCGVDKVLVSDATEAGSDIIADGPQSDDWGYGYGTGTDSGTGFGQNSTFTLTDDAGLAVFFNSGKFYGTDGTAAGTEVLANNLSGTLFDFGDSFAVLGTAGSLVTDGTLAGTHASATPWSSNYQPIVDAAHRTLWGTTNSAPYGTELSRTIITDSSVTQGQVEDIYAGIGSGIYGYYFGYRHFVLPNGKLVFSADDGVNGGGEPWVSDGTEAGTFMLGNLDSYSGRGSSPSQFMAFGNRVAFVAYLSQPNGTAGYSGTEIVLTDGTTAGTTWMDIYPGGNSSYPTLLGVANGKLYFTATDASSKAIFSADGTSFTRLAGVNANGTLLAWNEHKAYFSLSDATHGDELWLADFDASTFSLVKDILPGSGAALPGNASLIGDSLVFTAYTSATAQGLFVSDGTLSGTVQIGSSIPTDKVVFGGAMVFVDGTSIKSVNVTTAAVSTLLTGTLKSGTDALQTDADQSFFLAGTGVLYASDGTLAGTRQLGSNIAKFEVVAENAVYAIIESNGQASLWYGDGSGALRYVEDLAYAASAYNLNDAVAIKTVGHADWQV